MYIIKNFEMFVYTFLHNYFQWLTLAKQSVCCLSRKYAWYCIAALVVQITMIDSGMGVWHISLVL